MQWIPGLPSLSPLRRPGDEASSPRAIAIHGDYMYIADSNNHRIQKLSALHQNNYELLYKIGEKGSGDKHYICTLAMQSIAHPVCVIWKTTHRFVKKHVSYTWIISSAMLGGQKRGVRSNPPLPPVYGPISYTWSILVGISNKKRNLTNAVVFFFFFLYYINL